MILYQPSTGIWIPPPVGPMPIPPSPPAEKRKREEDEIRRQIRPMRCPGQAPAAWREFEQVAMPAAIILVRTQLLGASGPWLVDNFTGTAATNITAHTADTGQSWTVLSGTWLLDGSGNVYKSTADGNNLVYVDVGQNNADVQLTYGSSGSGILGIINYSGTGGVNWMEFQFYSNTLKLYLYVTEMGSWSYTRSPVAGDILRINVAEPGGIWTANAYYTKVGSAEDTIFTNYTGAYALYPNWGFDSYFSNQHYDKIAITKL